MYTAEDLQSKTLTELKEIGSELNVLPTADRRCRQNWIDAIASVNPPLLQLLEVSPAVETVPEAISQTVEISPGVSFDVVEFQQTHAAEIESYFESFTEADRPPSRGDNGRDRLQNEQRMSQSAIAQAAKNSPGVESDLNPILTGIVLSDKFLATYPPYFGDVHYKAEEDTGQLNLLEPVTDDEPPDPDDFPNLDAFREALARWDAEDAEALTVSMDSMCEWAPCPDEWYEPEGEILPLNASSMMEINLSQDKSTTSQPQVNRCKFLIPVFDAWCDRQNRQTDIDEPPDTGIFARLPKPKPPSFPPIASQPQVRSSQFKSGQVSQSRNYPETIPKLFHRVAAASSLSGRSPPGGDAHH